MTKDSNRLTLQQVLRRYEEEQLPNFVGMRLTDANQIGLFGDRPLHVACVRGNMDEVESLIDAGADINARGELGNTPLHEAVHQNNIEVVELLLQRGASRAIQNDWGKTPLDTAKSQERNEIVSL